VRAETWAIGGRHQGEVLAGARRELTAPGISFRRALLLKGVIRNAKFNAKALARKAPSVID
jgi:hypothetical protein